MDVASALSYPPKWPLIFFAMCVVFCFTASSIFHLYFIRSVKVWRILAKFDYGGICFLIIGGLYPFMIYVFACKEVRLARNFFMGITTSAGLITLILLMSEKYSRPEYRSIRAFFMCVMAVTTLLAPAYLSIYDLEQYLTPYSVVPYLCQFAVCLVGVTCYVCRFPESYSPGTFDFMGSSH